MSKEKKKSTSSDTIQTVQVKPNYKELKFCGTSEADLAAFPSVVKRPIGHDLYHVQSGGLPTDFKPFPLKKLMGIYEVRVHDGASWYRAAYVSKLSEAVFVLHCFQKQSNATAQTDKDVIEERYKEAVRRNEQLKRQKSSNDNRQEN